MVGIYRSLWKNEIPGGSVKSLKWMCFSILMCGTLFAQTGEQGYLSVTSEPAGATVFVDGKESGKTPLKRLPLASGVHSMDVVSPCHEDNFGYNRGREIFIEPNGTLAVSLTLTDRIEKLTLVVQDKEEKALSEVAVFARERMVGKAPGSFLMPVCVGTVILAKDGFADASIKVDLREPKKFTVKMVSTGKPSPLLSGMATLKQDAAIPSGLPKVSVIPTPPSSGASLPAATIPVSSETASAGKQPAAESPMPLQTTAGFDGFKKRFPYFWYGVGVAAGGALVAIGGIVCNHYADKKYDEYESLSSEERILEEMAKPDFDRDAYLARIDRAKSDGNDLVWVRNGLYIAGAAIFAGGVVLAFFPELDDEKKKVSMRLVPAYLPGGAGVWFDMRF